MDFGKLINVFYPSRVDGYFRNELPNAAMGAVVTNVVIAIVILTLASLISTFVSTAFSGVLASISGDVGGAFVAGTFNLVMVVVGAVMGFILFFVGGYILYFIAKLLGGGGTAIQILYLLSIIFLALSPLSAVITLLSIIPCVGCLLLPVSLAILVYTLYLDYKAIRAVCKLDSGKTIITMVLWIIVMVIIYVIIGLAVLFLGLATTLGMESLASMDSLAY